MRKGAGILIIDEKCRVMLQHRDGKAPTNPNKWGIFGGGIDEGETPVAAAVRELKEELTIDVAPEELHLLGRYMLEEYDLDTWIFVLKDTGQYQYDQKEGDGKQFFTREELKHAELTRMLSAEDTPIFSDFFKRCSAGSFI